MNDPLLTSKLEAWFTSNARDLPWRTSHRDPYHSLVSEIMLQQTQVSRVLEKFPTFIEKFPTVDSLANATEDQVLAMWAGLGYYRRARMLHACAKAIVSEHQSIVPSSVEELLKLPGIGRYTAGAIASMVFHQRAPIVDGNITRVLLRLHNQPIPQTDKKTVDWAWSRADDIVNSSQNPACLNEAMMELGATVCTPKNIRCDQCPIIAHCQSRKAGTTESIPLPKPRAKQRKLYCSSIVFTQNQSVLIERRDSKGMWSNMYQVPTIEREDRQPTPEEITTHLGVGADSLEPAGSFTHITTHRIVEFDIYRSKKAIKGADLNYRTIKSLDELAFSNAQRRILSIVEAL
ncbi:MAG: A/G-specific adenine glycosylase [Phycisphaerales bacterium]|nr:A/G-specific adenine glycosylase [Phycisphaerales bacterium]